MKIDLEAHEASALVRALDAYLPVLEFDLSRIKLMRDRKELIELDDTLRGVRARLVDERLRSP